MFIKRERNEYSPIRERFIAIIYRYTYILINNDISISKQTFTDRKLNSAVCRVYKSRIPRLSR